MPVQTQTQNFIQNSIRDSLSNSSHGQCDEDSLQNKLISNAKRYMTKTIEYEETESYTPSMFNSLKEKYTVFQANCTNSSSTASSSKSAEKTQNQQNSANGINGATNTSQLPAPKRVLFFRDDVQIGWKSNGYRWQAGSGMINVGNTCYLNSTLQAVFHVPSMANWLLSDSKHRETCEDSGGGQGGCIICAMAKTLLSSQTSQNAIKPWLVYSKLKLVCKHLTLGRQEDAHEFLRYLIESMEKLYLGRFKNHKELDQYSKETTPLNQILGGYLRSAVKCLSCQHVSTTFQHFQDLLLDIRKANSVEEALEGYFARERLEDMGYKCEACKKRVSATKQFTLERAPIALCIQLKRFSMMGSKLNKHVQIRQRLDLSTYASQSLKKSGEKLSYRLVSMVTHLGSSQNCGHYTAIGLTDSGSYYQFDDSYVRSIPVQNVMNTNAYIIFYELDDSHLRTASSSTMTSSSVFMNESVNGFNKKTQENGTSPSTSQFNKNGNNESNRSTNSNNIPISKLDTKSSFIGPQLPQQMQQQRDNSVSPTKSNKPNAITVQEYANRKHLKLEGSGNENDASPFNQNRTLKPNGNGTINGLPAKHEKLVIHFKNTKYDNQLKSPTVTIAAKADNMKSTTSVKKTLTFANTEAAADQLPHMPNLSGDTTELNKSQSSSIKSETDHTTPTKSVVVPTTPSTVSPSTKRLVPYESDESDEEDANAKDIGSNKNGGRSDSSNGYSTASSLSNGDDMVQTKAGLFQVSDSSIKRPSKHGSTTKTSYLIKDESPSKAATAPNRQSSGNTNGIGGLTNGNGNGNAVNSLLKLSHRGYGASGISTWNGERSAMEKEVLRDKREERKRQSNADEDDDVEMDRGRVKKVKSNNHYDNGNGSHNGYNAFQAQQNRQFNGNGNGNNYQQRNGYATNRYYNNNNNNNNNQKNSYFSHRPNNYNNFNRNNNFRNNNNHQKRPFHNNHNNNSRGNFQRRY